MRSASLGPCRELEREGPHSLPVGVFLPLLPLLVDGRLLLDSNGVGKGGNAQSKLAESSGLGGRGSNMRGLGLVMLRIGGGGLLDKLLPDRELLAGEIGVSV
jgi:hypothetical protein